MVIVPCYCLLVFKCLGRLDAMAQQSLRCWSGTCTLTHDRRDCVNEGRRRPRRHYGLDLLQIVAQHLRLLTVLAPRGLNHYPFLLLLVS